jgi:hypothetical protein
MEILLIMVAPIVGIRFGPRCTISGGAAASSPRPLAGAPIPTGASAATPCGSGRPPGTPNTAHETTQQRTLGVPTAVGATVASAASPKVAEVATGAAPSCLTIPTPVSP